MGLRTINVGAVNLWSGVQGWIRRKKGQLNTIIYLSVSSLQLQGDQGPGHIPATRLPLCFPPWYTAPLICKPNKATFPWVAFRCVFIITMKKVTNMEVFSVRDYNTTNWAEEQTSNAQ